MNQQRRSLARLLSQLDRLGPADPLPNIENGRPVGNGFRIGITGPLGAGKSTVINHLIHCFRSRSLAVGVIAIDPTSPFTGGAVLGDRVRMTESVLDEGVFIRSLATRGMSGGLTATAVDSADLLDIFGFDRIIIETVGVGQTEVDIMEACDVCVVVLEPSSGDSIQAIKAGLLEIADLFIVNKKDLRGADRFIQDITASIAIRSVGRHPEVLATLGRTGDGVPEVCQWLENHWQMVDKDQLAQRRAQQRAHRIRRAVEKAVMQRIWEQLTIEELERSAKGGLPVREAAGQLVEKLIGIR